MPLLSLNCRDLSLPLARVGDAQSQLPKTGIALEGVGVNNAHYATGDKAAKLQGFGRRN
jgi:hypothetical protein